MQRQEYCLAWLWQQQRFRQRPRHKLAWCAHWLLRECGASVEDEWDSAFFETVIILFRLSPRFFASHRYRYLRLNVCFLHGLWYGLSVIERGHIAPLSVAEPIKNTSHPIHDF